MPDELAAMGAPVHRIRRAEFNAMLDAGVFADAAERLELVDGMLVVKPGPSPAHARAVRRLGRALTLALAGEDVEVGIQNPFAADDYYQPEPDVVVIPRSDDIVDHPRRAFLVVEVSRSRLRFDRITKQRLYARIGIPEYWIAIVDDATVEVYREPGPDGYASVETRRGGDRIALGAFPAVAIGVDDIV